MRIGHYTPLLATPGGIGTYLRRVVAAQRARGHEVLLFNRPQDVPGPELAAFGAEIVSVRDDAGLSQQARLRGLDVLHTHTAVEFGPPAVPPPGAPVLVRTMHGHEAYCPSGSRYLAGPVERPCPRGCHLLGCTWGHLVNHCGSIRPRQFLGNFARVDRERRSAAHFFTIAISNFVAQQTIRAGYDPARIRVIHNPAPAAGSVRPGPSPRPVPSFLFMGRLVPAKGAHWLLRAAARVSTPWSLVIAGVGPQEARLRRLARQLGLGDRVHWPGWLDEPAVCAHMAQARAVIFPSLWHEPAGLITAESASAGRALIASQVGGIPEYAAKLGHALLVAPNDIDGLAAALRELGGNPGRAEELGRTGWERLQSGILSLDRHLDELEEVYSGDQRAGAQQVKL